MRNLGVGVMFDQDVTETKWYTSELWKLGEGVPLHPANALATGDTEKRWRGAEDCNLLGRKDVVCITVYKALFTLLE